MKMPTILVLFLLSIASSVAQLTNVTFQWDASEHATGYRFYDGQGSNKVLLGTTSNLTFTVTNWNVSTSRTVTVTATNLLKQSDPSVLTVPPAPAPVQNMKPVPLSIVSPVPGMIEFSQDLVDWTQRLRLFAESNSTGVRVTWVQYPKEPMGFMRAKSLPMATPPMPSARSPP